MRVTRRGTVSSVAAVLGIVSAAVLAWSVSRLVAERIGLSSAPPSVVKGLVPRPRAGGSPVPSPPRTEDASAGGTAPPSSPARSPGAGGSAAPAAGAGATARSGDGGDSSGSDGGGGRDD